MRYFQCSKCKILKTTGDIPEISEIVCHYRRMRELTQDQYDHEVIQREYITNGGPAPKDTALMTKLKI